MNKELLAQVEGTLQEYLDLLSQKNSPALLLPDAVQLAVIVESLCNSISSLSYAIKLNEGNQDEEWKK